MGNNCFTEAQQNELRKNPYVQRVSIKSITYTKEFKEKFEEEYRVGKLPSQILAGMGMPTYPSGNYSHLSLNTANERIPYGGHY